MIQSYYNDIIEEFFTIGFCIKGMYHLKTQNVENGVTSNKSGLPFDNPANIYEKID